MSPFLCPRSIGVLAAASLVVLATGCSRLTSQTSPPQPEPQKVSNPLEITADNNLMQRLKVGEPAWANVGASLTVAARLEVDETRLTRVGSPVMGRITSLSMREGQTVHRGDLLALLNSTGLSDAQLEFLKSLSQRQVMQQAMERASVLLKADVIGSAELQRREAELAQANAAMDASRDQLALLGMSAEAIEDLEKTRNINSVSRIVAAMDGTVMERKATQGQVIQPADTVCVIADLSSLWVVADVPEANAGRLAVGQAVDAEIMALAGLKIVGKISFVGASVNPETRTVRARMELPNPLGQFKPSMLATMTLKDQTERQQLVPMSAVVRDDDSENLFVQLDSDTFVLRKVKLGNEFASGRVLLDGVRAGEKIVLDGAFHLNNERRRQLLRGSEGS
jgi:cobalt-zinc-cadmium efflux system membrane fusion protein